MIFDIDGSPVCNGWKVEKVEMMNEYDGQGGWLDFVSVFVVKGDLRLDFIAETWESHFCVGMAKKRENGEYEALTWEELVSLGLDYYPKDSAAIEYRGDMRIDHVKMMGYQLIGLFKTL